MRFLKRVAAERASAGTVLVDANREELGNGVNSVGRRVLGRILRDNCFGGLRINRIVGLAMLAARNNLSL